MRKIGRAIPALLVSLIAVAGASARPPKKSQPLPPLHDYVILAGKKVVAGGPVRHPAAAADGRTYVGSDDEYLCCLDGDGEVVWINDNSNDLFWTPGDRLADDGTLWLDYPSIGGPGSAMTVTLGNGKPVPYTIRAIYAEPIDRAGRLKMSVEVRRRVMAASELTWRSQTGKIVCGIEVIREDGRRVSRGR